ncbi:MAG: hypothetical protein ACRCYE_10175 [Sarcina sp.]
MSHSDNHELKIKLGKEEYEVKELTNFSSCHEIVKNFVKNGLPSEDGADTNNINYFAAKHLSLRDSIIVPTINIFSIGISIIVFLAAILLVLFQVTLLNQNMSIEILGKFNIAVVNFDLLLISLCIAFFVIAFFLIIKMGIAIFKGKALKLERNAHNNIVLALEAIKANQN